MPAAPHERLPAKACDCHMHVYDGRFPSLAGASLQPADAPASSYRALQDRLGLQRCVVVTPSTYGLDNRVGVEAMRALNAAGRQARGVAVLRSDVADSTLAELHAAGVRGVRFNQTLGCTALDDLEPLARRVAPLGWHAELLLPVTAWPAIVARLRALPLAVVFDHFGRLPFPGATHAGHASILQLLDSGRAWVKLSGPYLSGAPDSDWQADAAAMAAALLRAAPERIVWGSNWPHPSVPAGHDRAPDDADLLNLLRCWTGNEATLSKVLVDNPATLYDF